MYQVSLTRNGPRPRDGTFFVCQEGPAGRREQSAPAVRTSPLYCGFFGVVVPVPDPAPWPVPDPVPGPRDGAGCCAW